MSELVLSSAESDAKIGQDVRATGILFGGRLRAGALHQDRDRLLSLVSLITTVPRCESDLLAQSDS